MTLDEIAKLAGVSTATVSRVINNSGPVRESTRQKVLAVVAEHSYAPNRAAQSLASGRARAIAVFTPAVLQDFFGREHYAELMKGVGRACEERGYAIMFSPIVPSDLHGIAGFVRSQSVDGILAASGRVGVPFLNLLQRMAMPTVLIGAPPPFDGQASVRPDARHAAHLVANHLKAHGRERIAIVGGHKGTPPTAERVNAMLDIGQKAGLRIRKEHVFYHDLDFRSGIASTGDILGALDDLDAVYCVADNIAAGLEQGLRMIGVQVPKDIAIIAFDNTSVASQVAEPPLTTIDQLGPDLGYHAATMLLDALSKDSPCQFLAQQPAVIRPVELVQRQSA